MNYLKKITILLILINLIIANDISNQDFFDYLESKPTDILLKYKNDADTILNVEQKAYYYLMIGIEIKKRIKELDKNFFSLQKNYIKQINLLEKQMSLPIQNIKQYKINLEYIIIPDTLYPNYYKNKVLTNKVELIYIQKNYTYKKIIDNLKEYYNTLYNLYYSKELFDFKRYVNKYSQIRLQKFN